MFKNLNPEQRKAIVKALETSIWIVSLWVVSLLGFLGYFIYYINHQDGSPEMVATTEPQAPLEPKKPEIRVLDPTFRIFSGWTAGKGKCTLWERTDCQYGALFWPQRKSECQFHQRDELPELPSGCWHTGIW
jgi:hypothetical protein